MPKKLGGMALISGPVLILAWMYCFPDGKGYYLPAALLLCCAMVPFFVSLERRRLGARELVLLASLTALGAAGRAAFFMTPQIKPTAAVVILTGACLGGEAGFFVGAACALLSNFFFGQGMWTPFQMYGFGLIGWLSGICFRKIAAGRLFDGKKKEGQAFGRKEKLCLCLYGFFSTAFLYGFVVDSGTVLAMASYGGFSGAAAVYISGLPFNLIHGAGTFLFLWLFSGFFVERTGRLVRKYGLFSEFCGGQYSGTMDTTGHSR